MLSALTTEQKTKEYKEIFGDYRYVYSALIVVMCVRMSKLTHQNMYIKYVQLYISIIPQ